MVKICNRIIEYSFYCLFLLVPWAFWKDTSELFEMNKMWLTWAIAIFIGTGWTTRMILQKKISFQRTPLDIPIVLFLASQIISTIFSLDPHVSFWGYYSRFNGGLLSTFTYIFLYYAFLSNFQTNAVTMVKRSLSLSLISGLAVTLWGLPSHFGYDPTCLIFRGTFDVSCWTGDFMPTVRIFSSLGQADWLAAYLVILMPISLTYIVLNRKLWLTVPLIALFYVDLLYTRARSGFIGIWISLIFFVIAYFWSQRKKIKSFLSIDTLKSPLCLSILGLLVITFFIGTAIGQLDTFTWAGISQHFQKIQAPKISTQSSPLPTPAPSVYIGGTESADIRLYVWTGAINAWKDNPIFGTGVETFAYAYYKYKPAGQNLTSEWNYLYNKAHNEYLNYLATTGIVGFGTYLGMVFVFLWLFVKYYLSTIKKNVFDANHLVLNIALISSYISILITDFFGFSVVITNIYLFMIPAFVFVLTQQEAKTTQPPVNKAMKIETGTSVWQWTPIFFVVLISCFLLITLLHFWQADTAYALGYNLDQAKEYQQAYPNLQKAVEIRGSEPVFKDELALNDAIIATELVSQKTQDPSTKQQAMSLASSLAQEAIRTTNEIISEHPNNVVFWKTRVRLFYVLSQVDSRYLPRAMDAIEKASLLAPNDATILYNLGVLYGQNNNIDQGISALEKTIMLRPSYLDAHYGLGLFYHQKALDKNGNVIDPGLQKKAIEQLQYILNNISPKDPGTLKTLSDWAK
jgi:tetratricopeptide (TPR) repeat protein